MKRLNPITEQLLNDTTGHDGASTVCTLLSFGERRSASPPFPASPRCVYDHYSSRELGFSLERVFAPLIYRQTLRASQIMQHFTRLDN